MARRRLPSERELALMAVRRDGVAGANGEAVTLQTNADPIVCRYHAAQGATRAVLWVGGAGGGLDGPARGLYPTMAHDLASHHNIASLRLHYRLPNHLEDCVLDTLLGAEWLCQEEQIERVALVGHSFGGAVVIVAGSQSPRVVAVVPMSTQTYGAQGVADVSPKPLLFLHGEADEILPPSCSTSLYQAAKEPKFIKLYAGARHGLDECRDAVIHNLRSWLLEHL